VVQSDLAVSFTDPAELDEIFPVPCHGRGEVPRRSCAILGTVSMARREPVADSRTPSPPVSGDKRWLFVHAAGFAWSRLSIAAPEVPAGLPPG
jgi:hypothetical protein